eukprot:CAMPEP_0182926672 /NCGR_PEP_ID=MMETSP0105_2-20130417/12203_1 /TAXON_ID=81532 ORGANISM="Acanthoeca-like sp., Strain 10tr" /NCGR_SAMPLE_ID=MMETSP0105_2 /ASSEMBLY_ACC=CAM_ASM_000205 /LENGTH=318 /DNA_ID=CAMNT_0025064573 /DNA_START=135 /DNA_END=1091 /DNA_ORIENTATION=-
MSGNPHYTQGPCVGGACLWFSEGCYLGCSECSTEMPSTGNQYNTPNCTGFVPNAPTLPEHFRTYNKLNQSQNGDWTRYHPWRSPGRAPVSDPCGVAGAYNQPRGGGGETPEGAHQGDKGSALPPTVPTRWSAGAAVEVGWMIAANHGGGYSYSLCPKSEPLTEACLNKLPLKFASNNHTIRYLDGRPSVAIPATDVSVGTFPMGSTWRVNPIPACSCDFGRGCRVNGSSSMTRAYSECSGCAYSECGKSVPTEFPVPFPFGYGQQIWDRQRPSADADDWIIVDKVEVPSQTGEYVLRWRWDTEQNPQVWTHCADVSIV